MLPSLVAAQQRRSRGSARVGRARVGRARVKAARSRRVRGPVKIPAPIGPVPRMLDQLKRRCTRLLVENSPLAAQRPTQRVTTRVDFTSKTVHQILAYWRNRSALTLDDAVEGTAAKLSLLVWRSPRSTDEHGRPAPHASVDPWHVIPVTQHEALQFQHIPVGMRELMISAHAKQRIDLQLSAMQQLLDVRVDRGDDLSETDAAVVHG